MPPQPSPRITPPQILALVIIWGAVAYGLTAGEARARSPSRKPRG